MGSSTRRAGGLVPQQTSQCLKLCLWVVHGKNAQTDPYHWRALKPQLTNKQRLQMVLVPSNHCAVAPPLQPPTTSLQPTDHPVWVWCQPHQYPNNYLPPTTYYLPPTTYYLPPTTYHLQPTTYHLQHTTYHLQPTTYNLLPTTYNLLPTTYNLLPTTYNLQPTTYYLPPKTYCLQPTVSVGLASQLHCLQMADFET